MNWRVDNEKETTSTPIDPVLESDMYKLGSTPGEVGTPSKFSMVIPTELRIHPVPSGDGYIDVTYVNKTIYTLGVLDTPVMLDPDAHMCILHWLLAYNALRERDYKAYQELFGIYVNSVMRARSEVSTKRCAGQPMTFKRGKL